MRPPRTLITGGAGFIGSNVASALLEAGEDVVVFDNMSRAGVTANADWLARRFGRTCSLVRADVRDAAAVADAMRGADRVLHFAAQTAVTTSLTDPRDDFAVNAQGTLNVLEAARGMPTPPFILYTSTNKVYGALEDVPLRAATSRYEPRDAAVDSWGIGEARPLDFHSPYGCSKGSAEQYVRDYARSFGLRTVVLRMSCIYGPRQFGTEDQGWVAHVLARALRGQTITIFGDGRQVRDLLFIDDLVRAIRAAMERADSMRGEVFNVGGGRENMLSLLELLEHAARLTGAPPRVAYGPARTGDQRYYVSDTRKIRAALGWRPVVGVRPGIERLAAWLEGSRGAMPAPGAERERTAGGATP